MSDTVVKQGLELLSMELRPEAAGNPCTGIVLYRRPPRGRLLDAAAREQLDGLADSASEEWVSRQERGRTAD